MNNSVINEMTFYSGNNHTVEFDGVNDYMTCGATPNLHFTRANIGSHGLTINVWYYGKGGSDRGPLFQIGGAGGADNNYYGIIVGIDNSNKAYMHTMGNSTSPGAGYQQRNTRRTSGAIPGSTWNMLTFVFTDADKLNWKIYLNGVSQTLQICGFSNCGTSTTSPIYYSSPVTVIGWNGRTTSSDFIDNGYIGDIGVWKSALSVSAISSLYQTATLSSATYGTDLLSPNIYYLEADALNLVAWWRMGDPYGSDTYPWINDEWSVNSDDTRYTATMANMSSGDIVTTPLWG